MNFCNKCGNKLVNGSCPNCSPTHISKPKKKFPKILISIILILAIILGGIFIYEKSISKTKSEIATEFYDAVSTKNSDKLQQLLYSYDDDLKINKSNANVLIDYLNNNPTEFSKINDNFRNGYYTSLNYPVKIEEVSKTISFIPNYKVVVNPTFINIKCDFKNYKITVLDQTYDNLNKSSQIGPLMPGNYSIVTELSNSYLNKSEVLDVNTFDENYIDINIFEDLKTINISSDMPDADLYVNNKDTGIKVKDAKNFGPIEENSVVYAITNKDGKNIVSNKYNIDSSSDIYINFEDLKTSEEEFKRELYTLLSNYCADFAYAVNYNDFNYISPYFEKNSSIYNKQRHVVPYIYNQGIKEGFSSTEILSYEFNADTNYGEVTCIEIFSIAKNNNVPKYQEFKNTYSFKRDYNGSIVLTDIRD